MYIFFLYILYMYISKFKIVQLKYFQVLKYTSFFFLFQHFPPTISILVWILLEKKVSFSDFSSLPHVINGAPLSYDIIAVSNSQTWHRL